MSQVVARSEPIKKPAKGGLLLTVSVYGYALVEQGGVEPPSESTLPLVLHA